MFSKGERPMFCLCRWQWANVWGLGNEGARRRSERLLTLAQIYIKRNTAVDFKTLRTPICSSYDRVSFMFLA